MRFFELLSLNPLKRLQFFRKTSKQPIETTTSQICRSIETVLRVNDFSTAKGFSAKNSLVVHVMVKRRSGRKEVIQLRIPWKEQGKIPCKERGERVIKVVLSYPSNI